MKHKIFTLLAVSLSMLVFVSCKKDECHECHFELNGQEVELGNKCGEDLKSLEKNGYMQDGVLYEVHCHEH